MRPVLYRATRRAPESCSVDRLGQGVLRRKHRRPAPPFRPALLRHLWGYRSPCQNPPGTRRDRVRRSEEHTSELQSLMRISYAVFCLKNKKKKYNNAESLALI